MEIVATIIGFRQRLLTLGLLMLIVLLGFTCAQVDFASLVRAQELPTVKSPLENTDVIKAGTARPRHMPWLDDIAEFFRHPIVFAALIALGLMGLIFEFKFPSSTIPGLVAATCFVLFFWAHSFVGRFTLLAILLFLLGLVFLAFEVFVVPGIGFSGVAGAILMFIALLLVTLDHWPENPDDWANLGSTFGSLSIGLALAVAGALALTWSLPSLPLLNRMVLSPPGEEEESPPAALANSNAGELLGAIGVAMTPLRPSGKAQFGERFLDVIAEGDYVSPGGRVQVVEIEGIRIIVKEV